MGRGKVRYQAQRKRLRRRLRERGLSEREIERQVERLKQRQAAADRAGVASTNELDAIFDDTYTAVRLDDTGYRPAKVDPLLAGVARATGATALAVRRRKALTRYEHTHASPGPVAQAARAET